MRKSPVLNLFLLVSMILANLTGPAPRPVLAQEPTPQRAEAVVLVNSQSARYADFAQFIQPYLDHFGVPYTVLDIAVAPVDASIGQWALILTGHSALDPSHAYLDADEQARIAAAVNAGAGLVNFDNTLSSDVAGQYAYINSVFAFGYKAQGSGSGVTVDPVAGHYITQRHAPGQTISTGTMTLAGITLPAGAARLAASGAEPFLAAVTYGQGRAVQWGSYDWMSHSVLGPLMGLDDLVWRSLVWAARKPFVMQGMPPFATIRMDDVIGPLDWVHVSNEVGFKPWLGIFTNQITGAEALDMKGLVDGGNATASIHAFDTGSFFYFNHYGSPAANFSAQVIADNFAAGTQWHTSNAIPISKYLVPHYYEMGSNALDGLAAWGIEFVGTMMDPGQLESAAPWMKTGPFRAYEDGNAYDRQHNIYYAAPFPTDNRFFNCITEFRDADPSTNYEWDPKPGDVAGSITYGTRWLTAGFDSMSLATLFSHEYMLYDVDNATMRTIMQGIAANIAPYQPIYVTMDDACRYARAVRNSNISAAEFVPGSNQVTVHLTGTTDVATKFYVFTDQSGSIRQALVDAPVLAGNGSVTYTLPGPLDHIVVSPISATVSVGQKQQFTATGYDAANNPIPSLDFQWSVSGGVGTITPGGLFTASFSPGTFANAVSAAFGGVTGSASVTIENNLRACPCSIWEGSGTPVNPSVTDNKPIEVGVKFRADVNGFVTGVKFYKGALNTGQNTGHLWDMNGNMLAEAVFTQETASGWQEVYFSQGVAINAGTTYIASYFSPSGYFADTPNFFTTSVDNVPLHALAAGTAGGNGVYRYDSSGFPNATWVAGVPNYWVDVIFDYSTGPDTTAPVIASVVPTVNASGVNISANVTAAFNEAMSAGSFAEGVFTLRGPDNQLIPAAVTYNPATRTLTLDPASNLAYSTVYTTTLLGGSAGPVDLAGNSLAANRTWSFTTSAPPPPPPDEGPGGPILVVSSAENPFGRYYAEILRNEGLNEFTATDISLVTAQMLEGYDVVLLGEMSLTAQQVSLLTSWVQSGGNLIAMRPDKQLAGLLGLVDAGGTLSNRYLRVDTAQEPATGITGQTIQFHSSADQYTASSGTAVLASLYSDAATPTTNPAVTLVSQGAAGGQAAAFTFDLARSVVYTRQGNPAWLGQDRDAALDPQKLLRSDDLFFGAMAGDPQPDWIDFNKIQIPQADEQQRLLANLILHMNADRKPLPRFWYFPRGEKAVIVMTGDDHNGSGTDDQWNYFKSVSPAGCSVEDWECIRGSSYMYVGNAMTSVEAAAFTAEGFEVALHFDTGCGNFTPASLETIVTSQLASFLTKYTTIPSPVTQRTHCIAFSDWDSQPRVSSAHGVRFDTNYYYWPPAWTLDRPGLFTGSGMIMRFAQLDGSIIDSYQAVTQMTDESGMTYPRTAEVLMDNALGPLGYYGAFTTNMHTDHANHSGGFSVVNAAIARGVPVVSGKQMLTWLDGRNGSSFTGLSWNGDTLSFGITVGAGANGLRAMLPLSSGAATLQTLARGGSAVSFTVEQIKGVRYAIFDAAAGSYTAAYATDTTAPVISAVTAVADADLGAAIDWTTNEPATARVDYGPTADTMQFYVTSPTLATAQHLTLVGLAPGTTYHYRVTSVDEAGNATTYPAPGDAPLTFTTPLAALLDSSREQFAAGTIGTCALAETGNGEVILSPVKSAEFNGDALPADWSVTSLWNTGGTAVVSGGKVTVNGVMIGATPAVPVGRSLEFVATLSSATATQSEHIGLGTDLNGFPWAIFSTGHPGGTSLFARTSGNTIQETNLGTGYLGAPHRFRIDWLADRVDYWIDGVLVASHAVTYPVGTLMRPLASDYFVDSSQLVIDWMRLSPYASPCTFISRVVNAGTTVAWDSLSWVSSLPAGTNITLRYRLSISPDFTGLPWTTAGSSPAVVNATSQYIQYQAILESADSTRTPALEEVRFGYHPAGDNSPLVSVVSPVPDAEGVPVGSSITATFSEPIAPATVTAASFRLRADGATADVPATIRVDGATATLDPSANLLSNKLYHVTLLGTVTDLEGNALATDLTWSFRTETLQLTQVVDTTRADFALGSAGLCLVDTVPGDGAVRLAATLDEGFGGAALPAGWAEKIWNTGGTVPVSGGSLHVNGARANATTPYAAGHTLEFVATFRADSFQNIGFGSGSDIFNEASNSWAMFGTATTTTTLFARVAVNNVLVDTAIPGSWFNAPHLYRIEWTATGARFWIDGNLVHTAATAIPGEMRVAASDYNANALSLDVDWVRMTPYSAGCTFTSRLMDAGSRATWATLAWTGSRPAGTGVVLEWRAGNTAMPDASWSAWTAVGADGSLSGSPARYLQYRLALSGGDNTPVVEAVTAEFSPYANHVPQAADFITNTNEDQPVDIALSATDADADPLTYAVVTGPAHGTLSGTAPNLLYTPGPNYNGPDSFTFTASDGESTSPAATVQITVNAVNDAPVIVSQRALRTDEDTALTLTLADLTVADPDNVYPEGFTLSVGSGAHYTVAGLVVTPEHNFHGTLSVLVTVSDGLASSSPFGLSITVADLLPSGANAGGPYTVTAGQPLRLTGTAICPAVDVCAFAWDLDNDGAYDDAAVAAPLFTWNAAGTYPVGLQVTDDDGNAVTAATQVTVTSAAHVIALEPGWNLVSFNLLPANTQLEAVLSSIPGQWDLVYAWDASGAHSGSGHWLKHDAIAYTPDSLTDLTPGIGFWVHMDTAGTLTVTGNVPAATSVDLRVDAGGWNLVGYAAAADGALPEALGANGVGADFSSVYAYHAADSADPWKLYAPAVPSFANDLAALAPGWGYWVKVSAAHTWLVPYLAQ